MRSGSQTSTTTNAPPAYIQPYLQDAAQQSTNLYNQGPQLSADQQNANQMVRTQALNGSPLVNSAQNFVNTSLNGGFMGQNPYLDATFNRAAGAVTNQVQSNFGTAGRNPRGADAQGLATQGYNDLANQIYGGQYNAERQQQLAALGYAQPLANQTYMDAAQLQQVGQQTNPANNLDDYIARLSGLSGGYGVTSTRTPTQSNLFGGLLGLLM